MLEQLKEVDIKLLYVWIDSLPLSKSKKNYTRDFADGVLVAEIIKHFIPKLVEMHNYAPANSVAQRLYNYTTLNRIILTNRR